MTDAENDALQKDIRRALIRRIIIIIVVILALVVIAAFAFHQFKIYSNARLKLREAKNVKVSLEMIDTEYYAVGTSIYDDTAQGNIRKGASSHMERLLGELEGSVKLTGYDLKKRQIVGLEYQTNDYLVRYTRVGDEEKWEICLIKEILTY